jgi:hypothetical protein
MLDMVNVYQDLNLLCLAKHNEFDGYASSFSTSMKAGFIFAHKNASFASDCCRMLIARYKMNVPGHIPSDREQFDIEDKVAMIGRNALVSTVSAFECSLKLAALSTNGFFVEPPKRDIYLKNVIARLLELGHISEDCKNKWVFIVDLRNAIVHDNGIASKNSEFFQNGEKMASMTKGQHTYGPLGAIPTMINWMILSSAEITKTMN